MVAKKSDLLAIARVVYDFLDLEGLAFLEDIVSEVGRALGESSVDEDTITTVLQAQKPYKGPSFAQVDSQGRWSLLPSAKRP